MHTDVPEFRGANRKLDPAVAARRDAALRPLRRVPHADRDRHRVVPRLRRRRARVLARRRRRPRAVTHDVRYNTAMVLDTDTVFHGVDRIADVAVDELPRLRPGMTLDYAGDAHVGRPRRRRRRGHAVRLERAPVLGVVEGVLLPRRARARRVARPHRRPHARRRSSTRFVDDLPRAARSTRDVARDADLGRLLIDEYVRFPASHAPSTTSIHRFHLYRSTRRSSYVARMTLPRALRRRHDHHRAGRRRVRTGRSAHDVLRSQRRGPARVRVRDTHRIVPHEPHRRDPSHRRERARRPRRLSARTRPLESPYSCESSSVEIVVVDDDVPALPAVGAAVHEDVARLR